MSSTLSDILKPADIRKLESLCLDLAIKMTERPGIFVQELHHTPKGLYCLCFYKGRYIDFTLKEFPLEPVEAAV